MPESELLRVNSVAVRGLFGLYDHQVELNVTERVTILHGPNGIGKTILLEMLTGLLRGRLSIFGRIPFSSFIVGFSDETLIDLSAPVIFPIQDGSEFMKHQVCHIVWRHGETIKYETDLVVDSGVHARAKRFARRKPWIDEVDDDTWIDTRTGSMLTDDELLGRYSKNMDRSLGIPFWLTEISEAVNVHLIETQRLLCSASRNGDFPNRSGLKLVSTVMEYAGDLKQRISQAMGDYGSRSQALDQSFPQRLLHANTSMDVVELKQRMQELDDKRRGLKEIGLLKESPEHPSELADLDGLLDPTRQSVMTLYVQDTDEKLSVLDDLEERVRLLLGNVNAKFRDKRIRIDKEKGLLAEGNDGQALDLDSLSSGEQHELVLHYDLLFRIRPNTLVLIDEPELSLHVAWQKRFLPDLLKIVDTVGFDVMIATHSPFIVGDRSDLLVALGGDPQ
jgi:predicted ATP-binding protein involved in virulence